jgi:putative protease
MPVKKKKKVRKRVARKKSSKRKLVAKKKRLVKKKAKRKPAIKSGVKKLKQNIVGIVTHYFPRVKAAAIKLKAPLKLGDTVKIKGHTTDFTQAVSSLQINRQPISMAKRGQEIGLLVNSRVRRKDIVLRPNNEGKE